MKKFYFIFILCSMFFVNHSLGQYGQISMIGEFSNWIGDLNMVQDPVDTSQWTSSVVFTSIDDLDLDGFVSLKFRTSGDWTYNWGNSDFPTGTGESYGLNIPVPFGAWDVSFNTVSLVYNFQVQIGVDESVDLLHDFEIYPNPASSRINIVFQSESTIKYSSVSIYDMNDQKLINFQLIQPKMLIDISALSAGIYFVKIKGEKTVAIKKLIKID